MPYLRETLASIEAQTCRGWQILAWDNGSVDGTVEELNRWIPERLPGKIVTDRPASLGDARAQLVLEAPTELCAWIDADDINAPNRLELQLNFLAANPAVAAVGGQLTVVDAAGRMLPGIRFALEDHAIVTDMLNGPGLAQPSVLFRRSAVLAVGNYRHVGAVNVEDYDLWLRLAVRYQLANVEESVLRYRVHERSTTVMSERQGRMRKAVMERFAEHAPALYGCTAGEARLLSRRRHPFALPVLIRVARHLRRRSGTSAWATLRSPRFCHGAGRLLAPWDAPTRLALRVLQRRPTLLLRDVGRAASTASRRMLDHVAGRARS
ncbi:MAG TPA: glycosyltransferase [Longimicrobiales bacterium]|nr:glycosyltransferase [Longimicrobiales bacterium]